MLAAVTVLPSFVGSCAGFVSNPQGGSWRSWRPDLPARSTVLCRHSPVRGPCMVYSPSRVSEVGLGGLENFPRQIGTMNCEYLELLVTYFVIS
jgi:hypothetical protein